MKDVLGLWSLFVCVFYYLFIYFKVTSDVDRIRGYFLN